MAQTIKVVGMGPGSRLYVTSAALDAVREAEIVVGGRRLLMKFSFPGQEQYCLEGDMEDALNFIRRHYADRKIAVMVSGDTGIYSFARYLQRHLDRSEVKLEFIPGISAFQLLFARLQKSWEDANFFSVHGRPPAYLSHAVRETKMSVLFTGSKWTPPRMAQYLLDEGVPDLPVVIGKDLSYETEKICKTTLSGLAGSERAWENSLMVICNE